MRSTMDQTVGHMNDAAFKKSMTFIEYHVDKKERTEYENVDIMMSRLGAGAFSLSRHFSLLYLQGRRAPLFRAQHVGIRGLQGCWNKHLFKSPDMDTA